MRPSSDGSSRANQDPVLALRMVSASARWGVAIEESQKPH